MIQRSVPFLQRHHVALVRHKRQQLAKPPYPTAIQRLARQPAPPPNFLPRLCRGRGWPIQARCWLEWGQQGIWVPHPSRSRRGDRRVGLRLLHPLSIAWSPWRPAFRRIPDKQFRIVDFKQVATLAATKILRRLRSGNLRPTPDAMQSVRGCRLRKCLLFHHGIRLAYQVIPTHFPTSITSCHPDRRSVGVSGRPLWRDLLSPTQKEKPGCPRVAFETWYCRLRVLCSLRKGRRKDSRIAAGALSATTCSQSTATSGDRKKDSAALSTVSCFLFSPTSQDYRPRHLTGYFTSY